MNNTKTEPDKQKLSLATSIHIIQWCLTIAEDCRINKKELDYYIALLKKTKLNLETRKELNQ